MNRYYTLDEKALPSPPQTLPGLAVIRGPWPLLAASATRMDGVQGSRTGDLFNGVPCEGKTTAAFHRAIGRVLRLMSCG